jgi:asparagine synthase (glutamine-hydrolysing)
LIAGILASPRGAAHVQWRRYVMADQTAALYGPEMAALAAADPLALYAEPLHRGEGTLVDRCLLADQLHYLPGDMLMKVDSMSMAHGLEVRVPFLDRRVLEFAGTLAPTVLTSLSIPSKHVLRQALSRTGVDPRVPMRPKRGFNMPLAHTLRTGLRTLGDQLLDRDADCLAPHLNAGAVRGLWRDHQDVTADHGYALWTLLTLAVWKTSVS